MTVIGTSDGLGEVPPAGTDDRRAFLQTLTGPQLKQLASEHGIDQPIDQACWGWGAVAAGAEEPANCARCNRAVVTPLWFAQDRDLVPVCWRCALIAHLAECDAWGNP